MLYIQTNHKFTATYGVGSGNAPAPHHNLKSVGHLRVAFFQNPKSSRLCPTTNLMPVLRHRVPKWRL